MGRSGDATLPQQVTAPCSLVDLMAVDRISPPTVSTTPAQRLETEVFSLICGATWLGEARHQEMLGQAGFDLQDQKVFATGRKLTPEQAKKETRFACDKAPEYYGIKACSFAEAWARFGPAI